MQSAYWPVAWEYWRMVWLFLHPVLPHRYVTWQGVRAFWILTKLNHQGGIWQYPDTSCRWVYLATVTTSWVMLGTCDFLLRFHGLLGSRRFPTMPWDKRSPATATSDVWSSWWRRSFRRAQHASSHQNERMVKSRDVLVMHHHFWLI